MRIYANIGRGNVFDFDTTLSDFDTVVIEQSGGAELQMLGSIADVSPMRLAR
ncbi:MAG: hypothetical protein OXH06_10515 [Gemmatimonadetes bacterium]|nr:hypothetical protein [Gemmatimonadota bacterium]